MTPAITTTELLELLAKASKVCSHISVDKVIGGYEITTVADWHDHGHFTDESTFIGNDGTCQHFDDFFDFYTLDSKLDELVKEKEEKELKRRKRRELLSRLTDEEEELPGVK